MLKLRWVSLFCIKGRRHIGTSSVYLIVPSVITHKRGADPLGSPPPYLDALRLRPLALRTALSYGLPFSSLEHSLESIQIQLKEQFSKKVLAKIMQNS